MTRKRWTRGALAATTVAALGSGALMCAPGADATSPGGSAFTPRTPSGDTRITLVTGDVVHWASAGGRPVVTVEDDEDDSTFQTLEEGDDYYVIPSEVSALVGTYLDRELFNVAGLVKQGYTDDKTHGTPVIVQGASGGAGKRMPSTPPGLTTQRTLSSINAVSGTIKVGGAQPFGDALASAAQTKLKAGGSKQSTFSAPALPGVQKVWLDQKVHATLEESVPQTGAPEAWKAGFDGTGTTVAVLDTGIDATHPDLAGKVVESKNFTAESSIADGQGHGTHVASTVAGTGAASNGLRKGVAPGAKLAIGKVLDSGGGGSRSAVIAGMEWAASLPDVDAISMSLGEGATDGTDPVSTAVNTLTKDKGKLFVVAAGNDGPGAKTVGAPGTADAALTVGAVDKQHGLASFSSRGPRLGDYGIKPEITAPGVGIKAARAKGTSMGTPLDESYTSANGTSMATPHVAGAVALLKQEHPDWDPATLKAALVGTATPKSGLSAFQQGAGELTVGKARQASVISTPTTVSFGDFAYPHTGAQPITKTVTYTNKGTAAKTVALAVDGLVDDKGAAAPAGMVTVSPASLTLAPGASAQAEVTLDRSLGGNGTFSGSVVATGGGERVSATPIAFTKEPELYNLTIKGIQRNGTPAGDSSQTSVLDAHDFAKFGRAGLEHVNGAATVRVPRGTYSVMTMLTTEGPSGGAFDVESQAMMGRPEITISKDTVLTFDARKAKPITVKTPTSAKVEGHGFQYNRVDGTGRGFTNNFVGGTWPLYAQETAPVTVGSFSFASRFELSAPGVWMDLNYPEKGRIPADPTYNVTTRTVASLDSSYHADQASTRFERAHVAANPWERSGFGEYRRFTGPVRRVELVSGDNATTWFQVASATPPGSPYGSSVYETSTRYTAGERRTQSWFAGPRTPALDEGSEVAPADVPQRTGNLMSVKIYEWGGANPGSQNHSGGYEPDFDKVAFTIAKDGKPYAEGPRAFGEVQVPAGKARYQFDLDVAREGQDWWTTSTKTHTSWAFDSDTTAAATALPLLQVHYDADLDLMNTTRAPKDVKGPFVIGLDVRQPRTAKATQVKDIKAWLSYDDGKTWTAQPVKANKPGAGTSPYEIRPEKRTGGGFASLKVEATDDAGNTVSQVVTRAYKIHA